MDTLKIIDCVICKKQIEPERTKEGEIYWTQGNDAFPIVDGRCCNSCNANIVVPTRFAEIALSIGKPLKEGKIK